ncbi:hypothetical protein C8T65DRAFT_699035 [Cerioporus squamosus]|nr:hypothetical protein C8T65DRAFT_699035 [Cerioporus squamosus]
MSVGEPSTTSLQFQDISVVSCRLGLHDQPVIIHGATASLFARERLLIELPRVSSAPDSVSPPAPLPEVHPAAASSAGSGVLAFELPSTFDFEYDPMQTAMGATKSYVTPSHTTTAPVFLRCGSDLGASREELEAGDLYREEGEDVARSLM